MQDGRLWAGRRALQGETDILVQGRGVDGGGRPGTAGVVSHGVRGIRLEVYVSLASTGGPSAGSSPPWV